MTVKSLDKWRERLNSSQLPVFARTVRRIGEVATSRRSSAQDLSDVVGHDASMAARLIRIANSPMFNVQNRPIETISNAVVLIGFDGVRELAVSISVVEEVLKGNRHVRVKQLMAHAFHAAAHAKAFAAQTRVDHSEEVFVAALLKQVGEMAFWSRAGAEAQQVEALVADGTSMARAEQQVLGFTLHALNRAMAHDWSLGELAQKVHDPTHGADPRVECVNQGHELATLLEGGQWGSSAVDARLNALASAWNLPRTEVRKLVQQNMDDATEIAGRFGVIPPPVLTGCAASDPDAPPVQVRRTHDVDEERRCLRLIADGLENDLPRDDLMQLVVDGVVEGVGCSRAYFALLSADRARLVVKYAAGECPEGLVGTSRHVDEPGPLAGILGQRRVVAGVEAGGLPPWHGQGRCLMGAVRIGKRPVGVLYGEVAQGHVATDQQAGFRQLAQQLALVLTQTG